jgi:hypothetical protein
LLLGPPAQPSRYWGAESPRPCDLCSLGDQPRRGFGVCSGLSWVGFVLAPKDSDGVRDCTM